MNSYSTIAAVSLVLGMICVGCRGSGDPATTAAKGPMGPATNPLDIYENGGELPLPRPEEGLAYLNKALKDKTRLIEVFDIDKGISGSLDGSGRKKLRSELPKWWQGVEAMSQKPKRGQAPFRVRPDMGIRIYPPGSVGKDPKDPEAYSDARVARLLSPDVEILIYRARRVSRVLVLDPDAGRLTEPVFVIPSTAPMDWLNRLFAGKL